MLGNGDAHDRTALGAAIRVHFLFAVEVDPGEAVLFVGRSGPLAGTEIEEILNFLGTARLVGADDERFAVGREPQIFVEPFGVQREYNCVTRWSDSVFV